MKYIAAIAVLLSVTSCATGKTDPTFDIDARVRQHTVDPSKGIHIVIYPVDREGEK